MSIDCEPGGPASGELERSFGDMVSKLNKAWESGDAEEANRALDEINHIIDSGKWTIACNAENRYAIDPSTYDPDRFFLDASTHHDEPLQPDGKGPALEARVESFAGHEIPGMHKAFGGGYDQRSPKVPGLMLSGVSVCDATPEEGRLSFVPFQYMSDPELIPIETQA